MSEPSKSYNPDACCGADCYAFECHVFKGQCWGDVEVIEEESDGLGDHYWIHACQGHLETYHGGEYIKENE